MELSGYENPTLSAPLTDCSAVCHSFSDLRLQTLRQSARQRLIRAATGFTESVRSQWKTGPDDTESEIRRWPSLLNSESPDDAAIVMTGHQPVIFHSGLTFKYHATQQFAEAGRALCAAVIIDTDTGDAGEFSYPELVAPAESKGWPELRMSQATFSGGASLFASSSLLPEAELSAEIARVIASLEATRSPGAAVHFKDAAQHYAALRGGSMMTANLLVRWHAGIGNRIAEIPLSVICGFPEVNQWISGIVARSFEFSAIYNATLSAFRAAHNIRNAANPFPSLQISSDVCELPFWIMNLREGRRHSVFVTKSPGATWLGISDQRFTEIVPGHEAESLFLLRTAGLCLVPRGALITAMLRLLFSDLFVHGTGGGRYDQYTDTLIRAWWNVEPPPFAVASASRFLFEAERQQISRLDQIVSQLRDVQFNPQRYFGQNLFSSNQESEIRGLCENKDRLVAAMNSLRATGGSAADYGREIQKVSNELKATVARLFEADLVRHRTLSADTRKTIQNRTWPWFFFPQGSVAAAKIGSG